LRDDAAGNGPTNVAFDETRSWCIGRNLHVSVIKDVKDPQCKGSIVKIPNVK
jgi:hypothetical protein